MKIPDKLAKLLSEDHRLNGAVLTTISRFEIWFADNKMVFFPGFTDHGVPHVEAVMRAAEGLIRDAGWPLLNPEDAAVCIISIILHDAAMHLSEAGFVSLISPHSSWRPRSDYFQPFDWSRNWETFLTESSRFNDRTLLGIFGKTDPVGRPPDDPGEWTEYHKLLIGEFLRRHHATLAHEIALAGVPGPGQERLAVAELDPWMVDFAGLLARSHNLDLRTCVDRLPKNGRRDWRRIHGPFLMALLRIGDYLEIQAPRAPGEILKVRSLRSPISRQEWMKHAAVFEVKPHEDDPEALWVDAAPRELKTFLELTKLFGSIQAELDKTWAILGEVYGADPRLRELGIRVRRIRSTLDDIATFAASVAYVPELALFRTSDAEMLKLMVGPLYGESPTYGIRELMQNAIDACLEREDYLQHRMMQAVDLPALPGDVVITLEQGSAEGGLLTIEDSGVGMTKEIVIRYFLTAGASLRQSDQWHKLHTSDGTSRVLRSGRFGVGVLAAFLLGPEIEVTTRHIGEPPDGGISFCCGLDHPEVELRWMTRPVGTTIKIKVEPKIVGFLIRDINEIGHSWDWYTGSHLKVIRRVMLNEAPRGRTGAPLRLGTLLELHQGYKLPDCKGALPSEWRRLRHPDFEDVQWTWNGPALVSNDIRIDSLDFSASRRIMSEPLMSFFHDGGYVELNPPSLRVFDKQGKLPLKLTRTDLTIPIAAIFNPGLLDDVCRDILGFLLTRTPESVERCVDYLIHSLNGLSPRYLGKNEGFDHSAIGRRGMWRTYHWLTWTRKGLLMADPEILKDAGSSVTWFFFEVYPIRAFPTRQLLAAMGPEDKGVLLGLEQSSRYDSDGRAFRSWERNLFAALRGPPPPEDPEVRSTGDISLTHFGPWLPFQVDQRAAMVTKRLWREQSAESRRDIHELEVSPDFLLLSQGEDVRNWIDVERLGTVAAGDRWDLVAFWRYHVPAVVPVPANRLAQLWKEIFRQPYIPLSQEERSSQLSYAYKALADEVARWENNAGTSAWRWQEPDN